jgi:uncharacterized membrane protein YhaH (DUF805 family)
MDWQTLFLKLEGRIGQKDYWVGVGILFVVGIVLAGVPVIGQIWALASVYFGVAVLGKRLHDIDKSAWLALVPYALMIFGPLVAVTMGGAAMLASGFGDLSTGGLIAGLGAGVVFLFVGVAAWLGMVIWLGVQPTDPIENRFGPVRDVPLVSAI